MGELLAWAAVVLVLLILMPTAEGGYDSCSDSACYRTKDCGGFDDEF